MGAMLEVMQMSIVVMVMQDALQIRTVQHVVVASALSLTILTQKTKNNMNYYYVDYARKIYGKMNRERQRSPHCCQLMKKFVGWVINRPVYVSDRMRNLSEPAPGRDYCWRFAKKKNKTE